MMSRACVLFLTATQKDDDRSPSPRVVKPVTRTVVHTHLARAIADRFRIAEQAAFEPTDTGADLDAGALIGKRVEPGANSSVCSTSNMLDR